MPQGLCGLHTYMSGVPVLRALPMSTAYEVSSTGHSSARQHLKHMRPSPYRSSQPVEHSKLSVNGGARLLWLCWSRQGTMLHEACTDRNQCYGSSHHRCTVACLSTAAGRARLHALMPGTACVCADAARQSLQRQKLFTRSTSYAHHACKSSRRCIQNVAV